MVKASEAKPAKTATKSAAKTTAKAPAKTAAAKTAAPKAEKVAAPAKTAAPKAVEKPTTTKAAVKAASKAVETTVSYTARPVGKYFYAVGRRKTSTAVVKLFPKGTGQLVVQGSTGSVSLKDYFGGAAYMYENACYPFSVIGSGAEKKFDAEINLSGGGHVGQSEAVRLAFARALIEFSPEYRLQLKPYGLLKRDPRKKERKKPGLLKARKSPQRSKR